jgi:hypothetical protein
MDTITYKTFHDLLQACGQRDPSTLENKVYTVYTENKKNWRYCTAISKEEKEASTLGEFVKKHTGRPHQLVLKTQNHQFRIIIHPTEEPMVIVYPTDFTIPLDAY